MTDPPAASLRVVLVDDNVHDRAEAKALLLRGSTRRYEFVEASTGAQCLEICVTGPRPDCLVLDNDLPDMTAIDLLESLARAGIEPAVPVVVLTGASDEVINRKLLRAGAQDFVGKDWMTAGSLTRGIENAIERLRATRELHASEQLNRSLMEGITDSVAVLDLEGRLLHLNGPGLRQLEIDELGSLRGQVWWSVWSEPARSQLRRAVARARVQPIVDVQVMAPSCRGGPSWWDVTISSVRNDPDGPIVRLLAISRNVTRRHRDEAALRASEERLRDADRRKDEFLAMLGHELRNPLAAIRSASELIELTAPTDPRLRAVQAVLERQSGHMTLLIDGLLEVSRIARGKVVLDRQPVAIREVVEGVLADRNQVVGGIQIETAFADQPMWVCGDPVRLAQVFDNLIGNAVKFTPPPGTITIALSVEGSHVVFRVRDTGVGIRPELLPHVFDSFRQESQGIARSSGGLGLGLALVRGLLELHGASVEALSAGLGLGAEFVVRLPQIPAPPAAIAAARDPEIAHKRVLIVEDNVDAAAMLSEILQLRGHDVTVVGTGTAALEALRSVVVDVVLCDLGLPDITGYDVARAIRQDPAIRGVALVAMTGYGQAADRERTHEVGFDEHLTKPVDLRALERVLARFGPTGAGQGPKVSRK